MPATFEIVWSASASPSGGGVYAGTVVVISADGSTYLPATAANTSGSSVPAGIATTDYGADRTFTLQMSGVVHNEITGLGAGAKSPVIADPVTGRCVRKASPATTDVLVGMANQRGDVVLGASAGASTFTGRYAQNAQTTYAISGNSSTNDGPAIQSAFNGVGGYGVVRATPLYLPTPDRASLQYYNLTSTPTFVGTSGNSLYWFGDSTGRTSGVGSWMTWNGAVGGTLIEMRGVVTSNIEFLTFDANAKALNCVWIHTDQLSVPSGAGTDDVIFYRCHFKGAVDNGATKGACLDIGDYTGTTYQTDTIHIDHCELQGNGTGTWACWRNRSAGNQKDHRISYSGFQLSQVGIDNQAASGTLPVYSCQFSLHYTACIQHGGAQMHVDSAAVENTSGGLFVTTAGAGGSGEGTILLTACNVVCDASKTGNPMNNLVFYDGLVTSIGNLFDSTPQNVYNIGGYAIPLGYKCVSTQAAYAGRIFQCTTAGNQAGGVEPTWNTTIGGTTTDGTVVWTTVSNAYPSYGQGGMTIGAQGIDPGAVTSIGNHYKFGIETISVYASGGTNPAYCATDIKQDYCVNNRLAVFSVNDTGGNASTAFIMRPHMGSPFTVFSNVPVHSSQTAGVTNVWYGESKSGTQVYEVDFSLFKANAYSGSTTKARITLFTLKRGTLIRAIGFKVVTPFSQAGTVLRAGFSTATDWDDLLCPAPYGATAGHDVSAVADTRYGLVDADMGAKMQRANLVQGGAFSGTPGTEVPVYLTLNATTLSTLSAGKVRVYCTVDNCMSDI